MDIDAFYISICLTFIYISVLIPGVNVEVGTISHPITALLIFVPVFHSSMIRVREASLNKKYVGSVFHTHSSTDCRKVSVHDTGMAY